jgi:hypothetical protein
VAEGIGHYRAQTPELKKENKNYKIIYSQYYSVANYSKS